MCVAIGSFSEGQSIIDEHTDPLAIAPQANLYQSSVTGAKQNLAKQIFFSLIFRTFLQMLKLSWQLSLFSKRNQVCFELNINLSLKKYSFIYLIANAH
jgi:hypothetical protein